MLLIPTTQLLSFFAASILLALAPGPDNIFVLTQSALTGKKTGFVVTAGLCTGLIVHTVAVACGVAAIFATSETAFLLLKYTGAAYLLYLAWGCFRAGASDMSASETTARSLSHYYRRGVIMNVTNPKVSIFFLAFLPQFTDPSRGSVALQVTILGVTFICAGALVFGLISVFAGALGGWLQRSSRAQILMNRTAGTIFAGLAFKLATAVR
jgi:threonine/homoserine/homoserine lactone efflux protein